jgi:hypothetical protein
MRTAGDTLTTLLSRLAAGLMASIHDEPVTLATACLRQQPTLQDSSGWLFAPHTLLRRETWWGYDGCTRLSAVSPQED